MRAMPASRTEDPVAHEPLLGWFERTARDLPWREACDDPDTRAWAVLVSEVMLQQTPVVRVLPVFETWLARWPDPAALAADSPGEAVRMWGRLGYPRRALRLHAAAAVCVDRHGGAVPSGLDQLRALPGVGDYTAAAVASFAFGGRHPVLDTNVRRVLARTVGGRQYEPAGAPTAAERAMAEALLPDRRPRRAPGGTSAVMELGALVCTARRPGCGELPARRRLRAGGCPAIRPGTARPGAARRTRAPTGRSGDGCSPCLRDTDGPVRRRRPARRRGRRTGSGRARWTRWSRTAWSEPLGGERYQLPR